MQICIKFRCRSFIERLQNMANVDLGIELAQPSETFQTEIFSNSFEEQVQKLLEKNFKTFLVICPGDMCHEVNGELSFRIKSSLRLGRFSCNPKNLSVNLIMYIDRYRLHPDLYTPTSNL